MNTTELVDAIAEANELSKEKAKEVINSIFSQIVEAAKRGDDVVVNGLTQRYAAIWSLAASGSSAEVIARATGQPVGQIELILGLRRQIDGTRTTIPHASHT